MEQRPRSWSARLAVAVVCGALVAVVSLVGYEPRPRNAGAAIQPAPTSIAFVPAGPVDDPQAVQAARMFAQVEPAEAGPAPRLVAPAGGPEPAADELPTSEACAFPCVGADQDEDRDDDDQDEDRDDDDQDEDRDDEDQGSESLEKDLDTESDAD